jgi:hypothetical protein
MRSLCCRSQNGRLVSKELQSVGPFDEQFFNLRVSVLRCCELIQTVFPVGSKAKNH